MPTVTYRFSTSHWLFPPIIIGILVLLLVIMLIIRVVVCVKQKKHFFPKMDTPFLEKGWDKLKLLGTVVLFVLYIFAMQLIGFLPASILMMLLYSFLYSGFGTEKTENGGSSKAVIIRSILISLANSVIASVVVWFLFARVFRVMLP